MGAEQSAAGTAMEQSTSWGLHRAALVLCDVCRVLCTSWLLETPAKSWTIWIDHNGVFGEDTVSSVKTQCLRSQQTVD